MYICREIRNELLPVISNAAVGPSPLGCYQEDKEDEKTTTQK